MTVADDGTCLRCLCRPCICGPRLVNDAAARMVGDVDASTKGETPAETPEEAEFAKILGPSPSSRELRIAQRFYAMGSSANFLKYRDKMLLAEARRPIVIPLTCEACGHVAKQK